MDDTHSTRIVKVREIRSSGHAIRQLVTLYGTVSQVVNEHYQRLPAPVPGANSNSKDSEENENDEDGEDDADQQSMREEEEKR